MEASPENPLGEEFPQSSIIKVVEKLPLSQND